MNIIENVLTGIVLIALLWFGINLKDNATYMYHNDSFKASLKEKKRDKKRKKES